MTDVFEAAAVDDEFIKAALKGLVLRGFLRKLCEVSEMERKIIKQFVWFKMPVSMGEIVTALSNEQAGILLKAIYGYCVRGIEPVFKDEILSMTWVSFERWFNKDAAVYNQLKNNTVTRRKINYGE